jgi:hypothetical protein
MQYSIQRLRGARIAVVLVERRQLARDQSVKLIAELQLRFQYPVMLVAAEQGEWINAKTAAQFDSTAHLFDLIAQHAEIEWLELPEAVEPDLPF